MILQFFNRTSTLDHHPEKNSLESNQPIASAFNLNITITEKETFYTFNKINIVQTLNFKVKQRKKTVWQKYFSIVFEFTKYILICQIHRHL